MLITTCIWIKVTHEKNIVSLQKWAIQLCIYSSKCEFSKNCKIFYTNLDWFNNIFKTIVWPSKNSFALTL
jgi:hypothetical protein